MHTNQPPALTDPFGRNIRYLRLSVTDRCDFRCVYCMSEDMTFLPRSEILSLEELVVIGKTFVKLGVQKIRVTGGEPLVRQGVTKLFRELGELTELTDLCMTTNGARLSRYAADLKSAGVSRINVSLDSLNSDTFSKMTRVGKLDDVLDGIRAAQNAGIEHVKLNAVVLKNQNSHEVLPLIQYALDEGLDLSFIEEMPLGSINSHDRSREFISSGELRESIQQRYDLIPCTTSTGGPSRYWKIPGYDSLIGFISPHSENFCSTCNRVRVSVEGRLLLCLGNEHSVDLRQVLRSTNNSESALEDTIIKALQLKPEKHHFDLTEPPQILRFMNTTGG